MPTTPLPSSSSSWLSSQFWWTMSSERPWLLLFITGTTMIVASDVIYFLYKKVFKTHNNRRKQESSRKRGLESTTTSNTESERQKQLQLRKPREVWNTVLFFPDPHPKDLQKSSIEALLYYLDSAKVSIQLCMYLTSSPKFVNAIRKKHNEGLVVQVLTDYDTYTAHNNFGPKLWKRSGIEVRMKCTGFLMHHKFVIIDEEAVLTGSLNWTKQGMNWNQENVLVSTHKNIVAKYMEEFYLIWDLFDGEK